MKSNATSFVKRLKRQKEDALEYVIEHYSPLVYSICYKILSNVSKEAVEECVNDVFLTIWLKAKQYKGEPEDFNKWLGTIAKFKAIDRYRQLIKQQYAERSDESIRDLPDSNDVQLHVLKKAEIDLLLKAISTLPKVDSDIVMMKYFLHLTNGEIADSLNISISAVENRLYRGRKKLAKNKEVKELKERFL